MHRRQFLATTMGLTLSGLAAPALAQAKTKVRVGYLHTLAVDGQIWTGMDGAPSTRKGLSWNCASSTPALRSSRP